MKNVTDRISNPFGMRPPCPDQGGDTVRAVYGYGDANADFQLIGDHPGVHGGETSGVPFTDTDAGNAIQDVFRETGFVSGPRNRPVLENCFWSYLYMCCLPDSRDPTPEAYATLERFFDAELRAINAHILLPVGTQATDHVLREYTTQRDRLTLDMDRLHATDIRGRGFMIVPIKSPDEWAKLDRDAIVRTIERILDSDYRQTKGVATMIG